MAVAEASNPGKEKARSPLYAARGVSASATDAAHVDVSVSLGSDPDNLEVLSKLVKGAKAAKSLLEHMEEIVSQYVSRALSDELEEMTRAYRLMLRETMPQGDDMALQAALNRARLQERILAETPMADQAQACELLGLSSANPSASMRRKERQGGLLRFTVDGKALYPLFQFDVENRRVFPAMADVLAAKPEHWSDFRLLNWLTSPHLDFDDVPADALAADPDTLLAALARAAEPVTHG